MMKLLLHYEILYHIMFECMLDLSRKCQYTIGQNCYIKAIKCTKWSERALLCIEIILLIIFSYVLT